MGLLDTIKQMAKQQYQQGLLNQVLTNPASIGTDLGNLFDPKYMSQIKPMSQDQAIDIALDAPMMAGTIKNVAQTAKEAFEAAQRNASLPVSKGGLGLPATNTAMDRAKAMGFDADVYHGTKQNITGGFQPVYADNLTFTTPNPQFASDWIGKGARQDRMGDVAEIERQQAYNEYKAIREKNMNPETLNNLKGDKFNNEYDRRSALAKAELARAGLLKMDRGIHGNILPLKAGVKKTFNPSQDYALMNDYIKQAFPNETPDGNVLNMFKGGDYIVYETPKAVEYLKNLGYDSMMLRESASQPNSTLAVFNPSDLRSRFAAFDPLRRNEADILAGVGAVPLGLLNIDEKKKRPNEKPKKK